jgi:hypothetical protein
VSKVYVTTYEIVGEGAERAAAYYAEIDSARAAHWLFAESVGGVGFRPCHNGGIRSVLFDAATPTGWRKTGRSKGKIEAVPNRGTKAGKAAAAQMADLPAVPRPDALAKLFGYSPNELAMDSDRGVIYFPTEMRVAHPAPRSFLRLPRFDGDGFTPDEAVLRALPESELMKAVEDHNAEAKRQREAVPVAA